MPSKVERGATPNVGDVAPDFTLLTDTGEPLTLSSLRGRKVVLFFYPKDNTPGCTAEACSLRESMPRLEHLDAVVLGISPDGWRRHRNFKKRFGLPYTLLSDVDHQVAERYDLWAKKLFWGRFYWGVVRTTFVIDERGVIRHRFDDVDVEHHGEQVAAVLSQRRAAS